MKKILKVISADELNDIIKNKTITQNKFEDLIEKADLDDEDE